MNVIIFTPAKFLSPIIGGLHTSIVVDTTSRVVCTITLLKADGRLLLDERRDFLHTTVQFTDVVSMCGAVTLVGLLVKLIHFLVIRTDGLVFRERTR